MIGELHLHAVLKATVCPGIAELGPVIGIFLLAAVVIEALLKQTELIPQAVAGQRDIGGSSRIQEASCQTAQTAVTQRSILDLLQASQIYATVGKQLLHFFQDTQVVQVGIDQTTDQIFCRDIICLSLMTAQLLGMVPVIGNGHHHSLTQRLMQFLGAGLLQRHVVGILQLCFRILQNVQTIQFHGFSPYLTARPYNTVIRRIFVASSSVIRSADTRHVQLASVMVPGKFIRASPPKFR